MFVDGQEMKTKLPQLKKGSLLVFETEELNNGKIRVSVELEEKMVTFDWKKETNETEVSSLGMMGMCIGQKDTRKTNLYFGMKFSHEGWKVIVE